MPVAKGWRGEREGSRLVTFAVWHGDGRPRAGMYSGVRQGEMVSSETLLIEENDLEIEEGEELLVEEVSIDGLCGVY